MSNRLDDTDRGGYRARCESKDVKCIGTKVELVNVLLNQIPPSNNNYLCKAFEPFSISTNIQPQPGWGIFRTMLMKFHWLPINLTVEYAHISLIQFNVLADDGANQQILKGIALNAQVSNSISYWPKWLFCWVIRTDILNFQMRKKVDFQICWREQSILMSISLQCSRTKGNLNFDFDLVWEFNQTDIFN